LSNEKTVHIIGAGMAGLCAGCYLQMNGYRTRIFELHDVPGGLCAAWDRRGYTFDGCIHFVLGSNPGNSFHRLWRELIDTKALRWVDPDVRLHVRVRNERAPDGGSTLHLHSKIDRLRAYLLEISPDDAKTIDGLIRAARAIQRYELPPGIERAPELTGLRDRLSMIRLVPALPVLLRWARMSNKAFARKLKSPFLREAFEDLFGGDEFPMVMVAMQMAWFDQGSAGYPLGGSRPFARLFADRYEQLGGTIQYRSRVKRIIVESDRAVGVETDDGKSSRADIVISAADGHFTIFEALGGRYLDQATRDLYDGRRYKTFPSLLYVSLGVKRRFAEHEGGLTRILLREPWTLCDGTTLHMLDAHVMSFDPTLAPEGATTINVMVQTRAFEWWSALRASDREAYRARKNEIASRVVDELHGVFGNIRDCVEEVDVATPATFHRYTNNWQGSYEGWEPSADILAGKALPKELPGLSGFYMVGQWMSPGGGLPLAIMHARHLAELICYRDGRQLRVIPPA
jgi:phytoene dehydrogenase-like protein